MAVSINADATVEWQSTWYGMRHPGEYDYDQVLARTTFPFLIAENWGSEAILESSQWLAPFSRDRLDDKIGFQAYCDVFITSDDVYRIVIVANNGIILHVDDEVLIHSWDNVLPDGGGTRSVSAEIKLDAGRHRFELWYYEWEGIALLYFDSNISPLASDRMVDQLNEARMESEDAGDATLD